MLLNNIKSISILVFIALASICQQSHSISSGGSEDGILSMPGQINVHSFSASSGDSINLSISGSTTMWMELYQPGGTRIANTSTVISLNNLIQGGTYTVRVRTYQAITVGSYSLYFTNAPGAYEHGALVNGGVRTETLSSGDLDSYSFTASSGDSINLSVAGDLTLWMELYDPNGKNIANTSTIISLNSLKIAGHLYRCYS